MTTIKKWGGVTLGIALLGLLGLFVVLLPEGNHDQTLAQDKVLLGAASDLHPTTVFSVTTRVSSLEEAFQAAGIEYHPDDKVSYFPDPSLGLGTVITVQRALPVTIADGKHSGVVRTWSNTVGDLLSEKKIVLGHDDRIAPTVATPLGLTTKITITRVAVTSLDIPSDIPFTTIKQNDSNLDQGQTRIDRKGINGQLISTYKVTREDGDEVSRILVGTKVAVAPQSELLIIGTRPKIIVDCRYNDWVLAAAIKYGQDPNALCYRMMAESHGNPNIDGRYKGLFQYDPGYWASISVKAGFAGASIFDAHAQIFTTAYAWAHGDRGRWPIP